MTIKPITAPHRRTDPIIPVDHPLFVWHSHADVDVQRTWRRYGWVPQSELRRSQPSDVRQFKQAKG